MNAVAIPQAETPVRVVTTDQRFARVELSDTCIDAANRTASKFDAGYPGWELYSRIVRGDTVFDRKLAAWAVSAARLYSRARKVNGHAVVAPRGRSGAWIAQAGLDALEFVIHGYYTESAYTMAEWFGKDDSQYRKFRGEVAALMLDGFEMYRSELHYQYSRVCRDESRVNYFGPTVGSGNRHVMLMTRGNGFPGSEPLMTNGGCFARAPLPDSDTL
jgi:hypothetical protein